LIRSVEENIQALTRTVLNEARAEAERLSADAQAKAEAVRTQAQNQAAAERAEILARATQEADRIRSQSGASAQLQAHTAALARREKLLNNVFDAVRQQLPDVAQRADYDQIARQLLREALLHLGADTVLIQADALTRTHLTDQVLGEIAADLHVQVQHGAQLEHGVGLLVQTEDGHRQYDNTLEARLMRLQNTLRAPVLRLLMGEEL
jgi:V/A-type H+/Na+-transporting ATPase subunit E